MARPPDRNPERPQQRAPSPDKTAHLERVAKRFGRYQLDERIGAGGMAEVFRARLVGSDGFEKTVCVKCILPHLAAEPDFAAMFRDEAAIAARLQHQNIVQIFDYGEVDGSLYIAMEYVEGVSLARILQTYAQRNERLPVTAVLKIGVEIAKGLHHAHTARGPGGRPLGIVHRDVTPHNILISKAGEVKVADFGVARADGRRTHTQSGVVKGKLQYMAPEQALGADLDHRVDQFATGIVLWEALTGRRLFKGKSDFLILDQVTRVEAPRASELRDDVGSAVSAVVGRALQKDREQRYADMAAFERALDEVLFATARNVAATDLRPVVARVNARRPDPQPAPTVSVRSPLPLDKEAVTDPFDETIATGGGVWLNENDTPQMGAFPDPRTGARKPPPAAGATAAAAARREVSESSASGSGPWATRDMRAQSIASAPTRALADDPTDGLAGSPAGGDAVGTRSGSGAFARTGTAPSFSGPTLVTAPTLPAHATGGGLHARYLVAGGAALVGALVTVAVAFAIGRAPGRRDDDGAARGGAVPVTSVKIGAGGIGSTCGAHDELSVSMTAATSGLAWVGVVRPGANEPGEVRVVVGERRERLGLVLAAESTTKWRLDAADAARIERVLLLSAWPQTLELEGAPEGGKGIAVDDLSADGGAAARTLSWSAAGVVAAVERKGSGLALDNVVVCQGMKEVAIVAPVPIAGDPARPPPAPVARRAPAQGIVPKFRTTGSGALQASCDGGQRALRYTDAGADSAAGVEVHAVGGAGTGAVLVSSSRSRKHALLLASDAPKPWKLERAPGSGLRMIVLSGAKGQRVSGGGAGSDVDVVDLTQHGETSGWRWPELDAGAALAVSFAWAAQESGGRIASYVGCEGLESVSIDDGALFEPAGGAGSDVAGPADLVTARDRLRLVTAPPPDCQRVCPDPLRLPVPSFNGAFSDDELDPETPPETGDVRRRLEERVITVDDVRAVFGATERCRLCAQ